MIQSQIISIFVVYLSVCRVEFESRQFDTWKEPGRVNKKRATDIAFPTNHFVAIILACERFETRLDNSTAKAENEMKS